MRVPVQEYPVPKSEEELLNFQAKGDAEGPWLEYKSSKLLDNKNDKIFEILSKEITAFANSNGGVIIIGADEDSDRRISKISPIIDKSKRDSWIEDGLLSRIHPPLKYYINTINIDGGHVLVIDVPPSYSGPHQAADKKFYARRQFRVDPLLQFEIEDIRRRTAPDEVSANVKMIGDHGAINFLIFNSGSRSIFDVSFKINGIENMDIASEWQPGLGRPYTEPFKILHPGEERYFLGAGYNFFKNKLEDEMVVSIEFSDTSGARRSSSSSYYLRDFEIISRQKTPIEKIMEEGLEELKKLSKTLQDTSRSISDFKNGVLHPTGLNLSRTTLKSLSEGGHVKWPGRFLGHQAISELLEVDLSTAIDIQEALYGNQFYNNEIIVSLDELNFPNELKDRINSRLELLTHTDARLKTSRPD